MAEKHSMPYQPNVPLTVAEAILNNVDVSISCWGSSPKNKEAAIAAVTNESKCCFCGYSKHPCAIWSARNAVCNGSEKKWHFCRVCLFDNSTKCMAVTNLSVLATATPKCLSKAITDITINRMSRKTLIYTASSEYYISEDIVPRKKLKVLVPQSTITMSTDNLISTIPGHVIDKHGLQFLQSFAQISWA